MKEPKRIELTQKEINDLLNRIEGKLEDHDYETIKGLANTVTFLHDTLQEKKISIKRLKRLFGIKTEKSSRILKNSETKKAGSEGLDISDDPSEQKSVPESKKPDDNLKKKGHGKNGAVAYTGAEKVFISNSSFKPGDRCPECDKGNIYDTEKPNTIVTLYSSAPINGTVYEIQKLRCATCGKLYYADIPEDIQKEKYDETAISMIALLHYGCGFPFNRLQELQQGLGIPLPASTQWDLVNKKADIMEQVYFKLIEKGAQGQIMHNDDTKNKILAVINELKLKKEKGEEPSRVGVYTTGVISKVDHLRIALFFTGRNHSGENMEELLKNRAKDRSPPIQMCDALSHNMKGEFKNILCHCLSHARRDFVDLIDHFPDECVHVIETLKDVYHNDQITKDEKMNGAERLAFHQENSGPLMHELKKWFERQFEEKKVEPNSSLGKAIKYFLKHWDKLTGFLEIENAPLDNNVVEQALKKIILLRKNSYFYRTFNGARVGDLYISIIETCRLNKVNPFDYLTAVQKYRKEVLKNLANWMPWNYHKEITLLA